MTYTFNDLLGLVLVSWIFILGLHFVVGGIIALFYRNFTNDDAIKTNIKSKIAKA